MNVVAWILQIILSAFFIMPGIGKISGSRERHISDGHIQPHGYLFPIRVLGILELLGCIGIIIPWLTGVVPILTPITATGYSLIMIAGMINHTVKKEYKMLPMLAAVRTASLIVAYYQFTSMLK